MGYEATKQPSFDEAVAKLRGFKKPHLCSSAVLVVAIFTGVSISFIGDFIEHGAGNQIIASIAGTTAEPRVRALIVALVMLGLSQSSLVAVLMALFPSNSSARIKLRTFCQIQFWVFNGLSIGAFRLIFTQPETVTFSRLSLVLVLASAVAAWLTGRLAIGAYEA